MNCLIQERNLTMSTTTMKSAIAAVILGVGILSAAGVQPTLAGSNDGGPFSHVQWGKGAAALNAQAYSPRRASNKQTNDAYNALAASRHQAGGPHITLPSATPDGNRSGWFQDN